ncbi:MAG: segregation/condensation protein A [Clostridiales Family XIII bacterium]|jgi:segregation and condensation protein A|nr:segregation/condensation protein A [Clostridiales Family XIII bacterium]
MTYKVRLEVFEGPFDLLVYLIESAEMNIYDIQISEITRQYLEYMAEISSRNLESSGEFMVLAAVLIELKSRMLLPRVRPDGGVEEDPRKELVQKILEYKKFKRAAALLQEQEEWAMLVFEKPQEDLQPFTGEPDVYLKMDIGQFVHAFRMFLSRQERIEEVRRRYERVERQRATTEQKIDHIKGVFAARRAKRLKFGELLEDGADRYDKALTFVALLEMVRNRTASVWQGRSFSEIVVEMGAGGGRRRPVRAGGSFDAE